MKTEKSNLNVILKMEERMDLLYRTMKMEKLSQKENIGVVNLSETTLNTMKREKSLWKDVMMNMVVLL